MALVRIKPYNPRIGHKLRTFNNLARKIRIRGDRDWHTFNDPAKLNFLRVACQNGKTQSENIALGIISPLAFDVAKDMAEAQAIVDQLTASTGRHAKKIVGTIDAPISTEERPGHWKLPKNRFVYGLPPKPEIDEDEMAIALAAYNDSGPGYLFTCC